MGSDNSVGFGFREVVIDQPSTGKWIDVDMNLCGGHSSFQGTKFSDFGGGFSYKACSPPKSIVQNRCIYWRTLNDTLELTEISMDHNLFDNQVRYIFLNSPIVGPITIHETDTNIVILVATVTSVHKFVFIHPRKCPELPTEKTPLGILGNNKPSIFHQICNKPQMSFRSFNLYETAINIPVPLSATCQFVPSSPYPPVQAIVSPQHRIQLCNGECFFAFSYENGSIQVVRISKDDTLSMFDLNQSNILARFFSGFAPSILRGNGVSTEAVVGMSFFSIKVDRNPKSLYLVTLGMNGHLRLWISTNVQESVNWSSIQSNYVQRNLLEGVLTDSSMVLKKSCEMNQDEVPFFVIYVPNDGFRIYHIIKAATGQTYGANNASPLGTAQLIFQETRAIDFRDRELVDFTVTSEYLYLLINNPEEEMEWDVKSYNLNETLSARFNSAMLEPLPMPDVQLVDDSVDPKEFYMDLVFNKSSFNKNTIIQALTMFKKDDEEINNSENWNALKITAMNMLDREIALSANNTDFELSDDDYSELCLRLWLMFYNSCVEYHIHTVKPLGLFYETNTRMLCVVKKSRISFLRPTDSLETLYYFPHCVPIPENIDGGDDRMLQVQMMIKYFDILNVIECTMEEGHRSKLDRRLRKCHTKLADVCDDIANALTETDPRAMHLQQRHFITLLAVRLKDMGEVGKQALAHINSVLLTWERDGGFLDPTDEVEDMDTGEPTVTEYFLGSRLGAHIAYKILKQMLQNRFMIARNTVILQSVCIRFFSQNNEQEGIHMLPTWDERRESLAATTYYFALLRMIDEQYEYCRPVIKDKSLKVANSLRAFTADHLKNENFVDIQWPMKLLESFCISTLGGLSIRSRVSRSKKLGVLAFAEAAGRSILPYDPTTKDHPLEEFLIATCQYPLLLKYAQYMTTYFPLVKGTLRKFYRGLSHLCLHNFDTALNFFRSITFREACDDEYFLTKYLEFPCGLEEPPVELLQKLYTDYYLKVIKMFQIYDQTSAVQKLAEDGLIIAPDDDSVTKMCSIAFKSAIILDDYTSAYKYLMKIPNDTDDGVKERKEKLACLRIFISKIVEREDVRTLKQLNMSDMFNKISTVREQVEDILLCQANLSDPQKDGVYQILYFHHITQQNFHKAASAMYFRIIQLGERGRGLEGLVSQRDSLLDVLTCLSLLKEPQFKFVISKTGIVIPEPTLFQREKAKKVEEVETPHFSSGESSLEVRDYEAVRNELLLCTALIKLAPYTTSSPVRSNDFEPRVQQAIDVLIQHHFYDDALELATAWKKPVDDIIVFYTSSCIFLQKGILPHTGDPFDYLRNIDISDLPNSNTDVIELAFRILQHYLKSYSKPSDSILYQKVSLKLISSGLQLPQWLIDDYKKRNASELLRCYIKYGIWEDAMNLTLSMIDATLGRRPHEDFDLSINKVSTYDPVEPILPFMDINVLANELKIRGKVNRNLATLHKILKDRVRLFCERVKNCTEERKRLFQ